MRSRVTAIPYGVPTHADVSKREIVGFLRAEPGVRYPFHRHAAIEEIFMLEGDLVIENRVYGAGDYIRSSPGSAHAPYTKGGCRFFFHTSMDDEYPRLPAEVR
jgi:anti-sigma factor ChrR (cupin superfamily)